MSEIRQIPHDPDLEDGTLYLLVDDGDGPEGRRVDERDIPLVSAWLREQGAIDYEAAAKATGELLQGAYAWDIMPAPLAKAIVDAALPGEV